MKRVFVTLAILLFGEILSAQTFVVPKDFVLNSPQDFRQYEQQIDQCIDYLYQTPLNKQVANRQNASDFFIKWIYGTPDISVVVYKKIIPFIDNKPLFEIFLCGYVKQKVYKTKCIDRKVYQTLQTRQIGRLFKTKVRGNVKSSKRIYYLQQILSE